MQAPDWGGPPYRIGAPFGQEQVSYVHGVEAQRGVLQTYQDLPAGADMEIACRVYGSATTSITNNTWTTISFSTIERQVGHEFVSASTPDRVIFVRQGWYDVVCGVTFASNTTGNRGVRLLRSDGLIIAKHVQPCTSSTDVDSLHLTTFDFMASQTYVQMQVWQDSGGALNVTAEDRQSPMLASAYKNIRV